MTLWVRYTASLDRLVGELEAVAPTRFRHYPSVIDDGVADVLIDVASEAEGSAIVEGVASQQPGKS